MRANTATIVRLSRRRGLGWMRRLRKGPIARGLTLAAIEGAVVGGMLGFLEAWIVPLLKVRLGASDQIVGLLTIVPMLAATVLGPIAANCIGHLGGNKRAVVITSAIQVLAMASLSLPLHFSDQAWALPLAITATVVTTSVGALGGPAWIAWMGGMIPRSIRGRFSSNRAQIFHGARLAFALIFMGIMSAYTPTSTWVGLQILIGVAVLSRLVSTWLIMRTPEPAQRIPKFTGGTAKLAAQEARDFWSFVKRMHRSDLGRWTMVWALLHFGVMLAGPYFQVYMLDAVTQGGLGLAADPVRYTLLIYTSALVRLIAFPLVGRMVDRYGASAILRVAVAGIALIPAGWALTTAFPILILTEILSGLAWCMAECAVGVLLFACSTDAKDRARLIGYHQTVCALTIVVATLCGGQLLHLLPPFQESHFRTLLLVSTAMRLVACLLALRYLPRLADEVSLRGFWRYVPGLQPTITLSRGIVRVFRRPDPSLPLPPDRQGTP